MKRIFFFMLCSTSLFALNRLEYNSIMLGTPIREVVLKFGDPYAVYDLGNGNYRYEYIERISMNNELVYENHYFLTVQNEKVVSKCFGEENRPPFDQMYQENPNYPSYP